jgi:hypothetical protein
MRVPNNRQLVSIPTGQGGDIRHGLQLNAPMESGALSGEAFNRHSWLQPIAKGVSDVAEATRVISMEILKKRAEAEAQDAFSALGEEVQDYLHGENGVYRRKGPAAVNAVEDTKAFFDKRSGDLSRNMSPATRELFNQRAVSLRMSVNTAVAGYAGQQLEDWAQSAAKGEMGTLMNMSLNAYADDRQWNEYNARLVELGRSWMASNGLSQEEIDLKTMQTVSGMNAQRVGLFAENGNFGRGFAVYKDSDFTVEDRLKAEGALKSAYTNTLMVQAANNPAAALKSLGGASTRFDAEKWGKLADISPEIQELFRPDEFLMLRASVAAEVDKQYSALLKQNDELLKTERDRVEKDFYANAFDGALTREDVEAQRDTLTPEDYNKFLKLTRGEAMLPDKSDPEALILLQRKAINGDADFSETAAGLLRQGRLTNSDYLSRTNEAQQWRKPIMKEADGILRAKTGHSEFNPNPDADNSYIMANQDFMTWLDSDEGKNAKDDDKIKMAERIGNLYRLNQKETVLSVPPPLNLVGTRTEPDIPETARRIEAAKAGGRLTDEQYRQEMIRLKRLADILTARAEQERERAAKRGNR